MELKYLKVKDALYIKTLNKLPIYASNQKFYVGLESLMLGEDEVENAIECPTIESAEREALKLGKKPKEVEIIEETVLEQE